MKPIKWFVSGKSKESQLIVPGVDVASGITPGYPSMPGLLNILLLVHISFDNFNINI